jgi:hypothetical protein
MDKGGYSATLHATVRRFNGGLFRASDPLSIDADMLDLLIRRLAATGRMSSRRSSAPCWKTR